MTLFQLPEAEPKVREKAPKNRKLRCEGGCQRSTWISDLVVSLGRAVCTIEELGCLRLPAWALTPQTCQGEDPWPLTKRAKAVLEFEEAQ